MLLSRSDITKGNITGEDILNVLPFGNTVDRVIMTGHGINSILESFAANLCPNKSCNAGTFVQVGQKVWYRFLLKAAFIPNLLI